MLDREARSTTLDIDPSAGKLRALKVMHLLRHIQPRKAGSRNDLMQDKVGQAFMEQPLFNFTFRLPTSRPIGDASLVAPEAQLATAPNLVGYLMA